MGDDRPIIKPRSEPFEACSHERNPSSDFEREVSVYVIGAA